MTPEELTENLKTTYGTNLKSVILYGSAAAGDHTGKRSDYNVLVLLERLGLPELKSFSRITRKWVKGGNPAPLFFAAERFRNSADVFPVEFADIQDNHRILFGQDAFENMKIDDRLLRLELEHELKGKLLQLRERYLLAEGHTKDLRELMIKSLSTFLVLFRNSLRLFAKDIPHKKMEGVRALHNHVSFDLDVFEILEKMKEGEKISQPEPEVLFQRYLTAIETVIDAVDSHLHAGSAA